MKTALQAAEQIVKTGGANLQRGAETVGGHLHLTNRRLVFESHAFNIQIGSTEIPLATIASSRLCWTKFLNIFPLAPNSLEVMTNDGSAYRFVLFDRGVWQKAIEDQRLHA